MSNCILTRYYEEEHKVDIFGTLYGRKCEFLNVLVDGSCVCVLTSVLQISGPAGRSGRGIRESWKSLKQHDKHVQYWFMVILW